MDARTLEPLLYRLGVPSDMYRLDGTHFELAHVLACEEGGWRVFLSERNTESDVATFDTEHEACVALFGRVGLELAEMDRLAVKQ